MECAYFECPIKEDCQDPVQQRQLYSELRLIPCSKCKTVSYCSSRCA